VSSGVPSIEEKLGYKTHDVKPTRGYNKHAVAAAGRSMTRANVLDTALNMRSSLGGQLICICPSDYEKNLASKIDMALYRETIFPSDISRARGLHVPEVKEGVPIVCSINDCPSLDLCTVFDYFGRDQLYMVVGGCGLGGRLGHDRIGGKTARVWYKHDGIVYCNALGCITQYADVVDRPWLDYSQGTLRGGEDPISFISTPKTCASDAGFVTVLVLSRETLGFKPFGFSLSRRGVIIDDDGLMPSVMGVEWNRILTPEPSSDFIARLLGEQRVTEIHGDLSQVYAVGRLAKMDFETMVKDATTRTINCGVVRESVPLVLPSTSYAKDAALAAKKRKFADVPFGDTAATAIQRGPLPEVILQTLQEFIAELKAMFERLRAWIEEAKTEREERRRAKAEAQFEREKDEPLDFYDELEVPPTRLNVVYTFGRALSGIGNVLSRSTSTKARRFSQTVHRVANVIRRPFQVDTETTFLEMFGSLLLTAGTVLIERFFATYFGRIGAIIVAVTEIILECMSDDPIAAKIILVSAQLVGHFVLALLPWYLALPLHMILDLDLLGKFKFFRNIWEAQGWEGIKSEVTDKLGDITRKVRDILGLYTEGGDVVLDQMNPLLEVPQIADVPDPDYETLSYADQFTLDGNPLDPVQLELLDKQQKKPSREAGCFVNIPELKQFHTTGSGSNVVLHAIQNRYLEVEKGPSTEYSATVEGLQGVREFVKEHRIVAVAMTLEEFREHMKSQHFPAFKTAGYEDAAENYSAGNFPPQAAVPFCGKSEELIKIKMVKVPGKGLMRPTWKTRITHNFPPHVHYPHILFSLGLMKAMKRFLNTYRGKCLNGATYGFYCPQTGTTSEMTLAFNAAMAEGIHLIALAGDDTHLMLKISLKGKIWCIAVDLRRCDTTIQNPSLEAIYQLASLFGASDDYIDNLRRMNSAPRTYKIRVAGASETHKLVNENPLGMNTSGTHATTFVTVAKSFGLWDKTMREWSGDPNQLAAQLKANAAKMGCLLEFEVYPETTSSGLTELGCTSFLSYVPVLSESSLGVKFIKRSFTKSLVTKGASQIDGGRSLDFSVASRAADTSLLCSPYGQAIRAALARHAGKYPMEIVTVPEPWKMAFNTESLTLNEEWTYIRRVCPNVTLEDYSAELAAWDEIKEFPHEFPIGSMRIFRALAVLHYGLTYDG
jgi:hypothetical protein